jgi:hypothetical protein
MLLANLLFFSQEDEAIDWQRRSAFLIYHWEIFHHAHRSLFEVLCGYYNVSFALLRTTLELLVKGAFWECLSHRRFRENAQVLINDPAGKRIKKWLHATFKQAPAVEEALDRNSASIYDKLGPVMEEREYRPSFRTIVRQLEEWGIFNPLTDAEDQIYEGIFRRLSADVHVVPERTDIGRRLAVGISDISEQILLPDTLREYSSLLHKLMDLAIVIELNIAKDLVEEYDEVKTNLKSRSPTFEQLGLGRSLERVKQFLE